MTTALIMGIGRAYEVACVPAIHFSSTGDHFLHCMHERCERERERYIFLGPAAVVGLSAFALLHLHTQARSNLIQITI